MAELLALQAHYQAQLRARALALAEFGQSFAPDDLQRRNDETISKLIADDHEIDLRALELTS